MIFGLLFLLGFFTYLVIRRSVAGITQTPIWLLWSVMMMPAFVWVLIVSQDASDPIFIALLLLVCIVCPIIYWFLVQKGRPERSTEPNGSLQPQKAADLPSLANATAPEMKLPLDRDEEATLKQCFPWTVYYVNNIEYRAQALICRGHLRAASDKAYETVRKNIASHFGDRFLLVFQEGLDGKPFFALVPNPHKLAKRVQNAPIFRPGLAGGLLVATLITTIFAGGVLAGVIDENWQGSMGDLLQGLPYAISLMAILGVHESAHYIAARRYRIRATLPYFIPVPPAPIFPFGTFGAFIQMRSPVPNRKALFDVGISGPLAGLVITIPILLWGFAHSSIVALSDESSILNFESFRPTSSFLIAILSKIAMGSQLTADAAVSLHPVAIAGLLGVVVTALNLMPVGQLDGGHVVHAMFGQKMGAAIGQVARLLVLILSFVQREFLVWAILLFFMPIVDEPALNDVSELDNKRDFLGLFALALLVFIVLPAPPVISRLLFTG
ncbi:MAG: site-2 protease family protein [Leptolyngbyaceae bacterium]|nr:site-2 protease family protein [Leptolyngbyaceae bacterium]